MKGHPHRSDYAGPWLVLTPQAHREHNKSIAEPELADSTFLPRMIDHSATHVAEGQSLRSVGLSERCSKNQDGVL